jgi:uncharacterized protein YkwD
MSNTLKRIIAYSTMGILVFFGFFAARQPIVYYASNVITFVKEYSNAHDDMLQALHQEIFSTPLRANIAGDRANLSPVEIIRITNEKRAEKNVMLLTHNIVLDQAATQKLQDMFDHQYFEHISPKGNGPGWLATHVGYSYVIIGENLAMGTFDSDAALLDAWMASPGHRANILNTRYTEIGVAVGHGTYNGERIWIAVQEFGKPSSACPAIDPAIKNTIEQDKTTVADMQAQVTLKKKELDTMAHDTPEQSAEYNTKVSAYNDYVSNYNTQVAKLKAEIDTYNKQVRNFNSCAQS